MKASRVVRDPRTGMARDVGYSDCDYWRMNKSEVVMANVRWLRPRKWLAVDDKDIAWPNDVRGRNFVGTDGCEGLREPTAVDRLKSAFREAFAR